MLVDTIGSPDRRRDHPDLLTLARRIVQPPGHATAKPLPISTMQLQRHNDLVPQLVLPRSRAIPPMRKSCWNRITQARAAVLDSVSAKKPTGGYTAGGALRGLRVRGDLYPGPESQPEFPPAATQEISDVRTKLCRQVFPAAPRAEYRRRVFQPTGRELRLHHYSVRPTGEQRQTDGTAHRSVLTVRTSVTSQSPEFYRSLAYVGSHRR